MQIPTGDTRILICLNILPNPGSTRPPLPAPTAADCQVPAGHRRVTAGMDPLVHYTTP
ncbi:hypothetical protein ACFFWC_24840 [Plantactinospora siamensis]|uniref:Uncharacterized protein n=1 Tax=Plantactinospora siamensis TaxID=555372 RepID=A0ABV6NW95_9ACTN